MADEPEGDDVLELIDEAEPQDEQPEQTITEGKPGQDDEEVVIGFGDEGAAPAPESESSVIRALRRQLREQAARLKELEAAVPQEKPVELGPKPTLESCDFDEVRFEQRLDEWKERKAQAERAEQEAKRKREEERKAYETAIAEYEAGKARLGVADFEEAEAEVGARLDPRVQALLLRSGKGPELTYALGRNPEKLEQLSKMNLADAAIMVGRLSERLTVERRSKAPAPDKPVTGSAPLNAGGNLKRLLDAARQTGDYSAYHAAKRAAGR